jgi:1-acyl-sn-glycerol-3-phosphate acyltransferase
VNAGEIRKTLATQSHREFAGIIKLSFRLARCILWIAAGLGLCFLFFPLVNSSRRNQASSWWARQFVWCLGIKVEVQGTWPRTPGRYMLVSNHITWLDIFIIMSVRPIRFVSKAEVKTWPVAGFLARRAGTLFINRTRKRDTVQIGAEMLSVMESGEVIGVFPEGTTSDGSVLLPFFSPLLQPAINSEAHIVPTGLSYLNCNGQRDLAVPFIGEQTFLDSLLISIRRHSLHARVCFGSPIQADQAHRREVTRQVESAVAQLLGVKVDSTWRAPGQTSAAMPHSSRS